jgi:hypothetical protein
MVSTAESRLELQPRYSLQSLDLERETLLDQLMLRSVKDEGEHAQKRFGATA